MKNNVCQMDPGKVSVILPTYNRKEDLRRLIDSILKQDYKNIEVIVIDNNSSDGTKDMVLKEYPGFILLCNETNTGICQPKNQGAVKSRGEYLWLLDSDTVVVHNDCLSRMVKIINSEKDIGSVGGTVYFSDDGSEKMMLPKDGVFNIIDDWDSQLFDSVDCDYLFANLFMRKELLFELGGVAEEYFFFMEDNDLGLRIRRKGLRNIASRSTIVRHPFRQPPSGFKNPYLFCRNNFFYVFKNHKINEWLSVMMEMQRKNRFLKRNDGNFEKISAKQRFSLYLILLLGFFGSIILLISYHAKNIIFGKQRYLAKYI